MDICDYGCGCEATTTFKNGRSCCSLKYRSCPYQAKFIGQTMIGRKHSDETKRKIGQKSKDRGGGKHFKGKKHSQQSKQNMSTGSRGRISWSRGLTKEDHPSIMKSWIRSKQHPELYSHKGIENGMYGKTHSDEVKEKQRTKNILERKWQGQNNPWYGKDRSGENSPRFLSKQQRTEWEIYKNEVRMLTGRTYKKYFNTINPLGLNRNINEYHLDHIVPIWYGYMNKIPTSALAKKENLRVISAQENYKRYKTKLTTEEQELLKTLME